MNVLEHTDPCCQLGRNLCWQCEGAGALNLCLCAFVPFFRIGVLCSYSANQNLSSQVKNIRRLVNSNMRDLHTFANDTPMVSSFQSARVLLLRLQLAKICTDSKSGIWIKGSKNGVMFYFWLSVENFFLAWHGAPLWNHGSCLVQLQSIVEAFSDVLQHLQMQQTFAKTL